ncbi:MAG: hypothetical protein KY476_08560, partial [Planctomycetes bacterium]|nr:hypothetical protein [Planctomycetota bacterium]
MKSSRKCMLVAALIATVLAGQAAAVDPDSLDRRREDQKRARQMAQQLVDSVLRLQLRQLEENKLTDLEIYRDIKIMRANIAELVEQEMSQVVTLLLDAQQQGDENARREKFTEARGLIRQIVVQLSIERQKLLRRLKAAEIAEQARRLIRLETVALATTESLPEQPPTRREELAIKTLEDQRDIVKLFLLLVETLVDVSKWDGAIADGAADGLRILKAADVGRHLDEAVRTLSAAEYPTAAGHQAQAIEGLKQLLKIIERTQGLIGAERQQALDKVRELAEKQAKLREKTEQTQLKQPPEKELVQEQADIRRELGDLAESLHDLPGAEEHLEQAKAAADEATTDLFDAEQAEAIEQQGKVLGHLAALEEMLINASDIDDS